MNAMYFTLTHFRLTCFSLTATLSAANSLFVSGQFRCSVSRGLKSKRCWKCKSAALIFAESNSETHNPLAAETQDNAA